MEFSLLFWMLVLLSPASVTGIAQTIEPDIQELQGISDYRSVILTWKSSPSSQLGSAPVAFLVRVCPLNSLRGSLRQLHLPCIERFINETETQALPTGTGTGQRYSAVVDGLRLATAYRFLVTPIHDFDSRQEKAFLSHQNLDGNKDDGRGVLLTTRGFAARVIRCQKDFTEVEVDTGPYFGGRLAVEGASDERCHVLGDSKSPRTKYILVVSHSLCHTQRTTQSLETVVVASESPSILTRSSRRFLVACDLLPDSMTVHATVNVSTNGGDASTSRNDQAWLDAARPLLPSFARDPVPGNHLADQSNSVAERRSDDDGIYGLPKQDGNGVSAQVVIVVAVGAVAGAVACVALALYARSIRHRRGEAASTPAINNLHPEPTGTSPAPPTPQRNNVALTSLRTLSYI